MHAAAVGGFRLAFCGIFLVALGACGGSDSGGGSGGGGGGGGASYTIGGTVTGLSGAGLMLRLNAGDPFNDIRITADGGFTFAGTLASGDAYEVTVKTQPTSPDQYCWVSDGSGTVGASNVTGVAVTCSNLTGYTIGGTVTGLTGSGLVLAYYDTVNPPVQLSVSAAGAFAFPATAVQGGGYSVGVWTQPSSPMQSCVVVNGTGTIGVGNITSILIVCEGVGRFAYVTNNGNDTISVYSIDATTGALTAVGKPVATGTSPYAIVGNPNRDRVYVVNRASNDISAYDVNATTGALTQISGSPFAAGTDPQALAFDPTGAYLYVANSGSDNLSAYAVNADTGTLMPLATATYSTGMGPSAVSVHPNGQYLFVANSGGSNDIAVFAIAAGTGELTPVTGSPFAAGGSPHSLVYADSESAVYTANIDGTSSTIARFRFYGLTGALSGPNASPSGLPVKNYLATDRGGGILYVTTETGVDLYGIFDAGVLVPLSGPPMVTGTNAYSVTIDPSGQFMYVCNDGSGNISGFTSAGVGGVAVPGSPFPAGNHPDFMAIL